MGQIELARWHGALGAALGKGTVGPARGVGLQGGAIGKDPRVYPRRRWDPR